MNRNSFVLCKYLIHARGLRRPIPPPTSFQIRQTALFFTDRQHLKLLIRRIARFGAAPRDGW